MNYIYIFHPVCRIISREEAIEPACGSAMVLYECQSVPETSGVFFHPKPPHDITEDDALNTNS